MRSSFRAGGPGSMRQSRRTHLLESHNQPDPLVPTRMRALTHLYSNHTRQPTHLHEPERRRGGCCCLGALSSVGCCSVGVPRRRCTNLFLSFFLGWVLVMIFIRMQRANFSFLSSSSTLLYRVPS